MNNLINARHIRRRQRLTANVMLNEVIAEHSLWESISAS